MVLGGGFPQISENLRNEINDTFVAGVFITDSNKEPLKNIGRAFASLEASSATQTASGRSNRESSGSDNAPFGRVKKPG